MQKLITVIKRDIFVLYIIIIINISLFQEDNIWSLITKVEIRLAIEHA